MNFCLLLFCPYLAILNFCSRQKLISLLNLALTFLLLVDQ
uniref:Uncharacterized protein n=1 Tax=Arundo donax TaxID=35708 RepID=A0A0A9FQF5_ARUDO